MRCCVIDADRVEVSVVLVVTVRMVLCRRISHVGGAHACFFKESEVS